MERSDWRNIFCRQPVHFLLFDASIPMTFDIVKKVCETLEQLFSLDISLKGSSRLSSFGLTVLGNSANCIFPLQLVKPNFQILSSALEEVLILYQEAASFGNVFNYDILMHAFQEALDQYNRLRQLQNVQTIKEGTPQLQITLLSCKNSHVLIPCIDSVTSSLDLTFIRKIEVLSISNLCSAFSNDGQENSVNERLDRTNLDSPNIHEKDQAHSASSETVGSLSGGVVEFLTLNFDPYSIENFFKQWLHDFNTDTESVRLIFSGGELSEQFIIKCDAQERMINPEIVPFSSQFFLSLDTSFTQTANSSQAKNITKKVPVYDLEIESTIKISGLCDSVLFGLPVIIFATRCWKMDWEELESNQKQFVALNNLLKEQDVVLLARRQAKLYISNADSRGRPPNGYYVIFPSNNQSMLIKSIITKEFLLPNVMGCVTEEITPSEEAKTRVSDYLKNVECLETYNPLSVSCGLYLRLANSLRKNKSQRVCKNVVSSNSQGGKVRQLTPYPNTSNKRLRKTPQTQETEITFIAVGNKKNFLSTSNSKISHLLNRNFPKDL